MSEQLHQRTKADIHGTDGFLLYTDVAHKLLNEQLALVPRAIEPLPASEAMGSQKVLAVTQPASATLFATTQSIASTIPRWITDGTERSKHYDAHYGVLPSDAKTRAPAFGGGFEEGRFPWTFSAAFANQISLEYVSSDLLTPRDHNDITLHDWADMIENGWFKKLLHNMAYAADAIYETYGSEVHDYTADALRERLIRRLSARGSWERGQEFPTHVFNVNKKAVLGTTEIQLQAKLQPEIRNALTHDLNTHNTFAAGCPVARYMSDPMLKSVIETNSHARILLQKGLLAAHTVEDQPDMVKMKQAESAIDVSMTVLATKLREYENAYGTPVIRYDGNPVEHQRREPTGIFGPRAA